MLAYQHSRPQAGWAGPGQALAFKERVKICWLNFECGKYNNYLRYRSTEEEDEIIFSIFKTEEVNTLTYTYIEGRLVGILSYRYMLKLKVCMFI